MSSSDAAVQLAPLSREIDKTIVAFSVASLGSARRIADAAKGVVSATKAVDTRTRSSTTGRPKNCSAATYTAALLPALSNSTQWLRATFAGKSIVFRWPKAISRKPSSNTVSPPP